MAWEGWWERKTSDLGGMGTGGGGGERLGGGVRVIGAPWQLGNPLLRLALATTKKA